jgi:flagellar FliL protein
MAEAKKPAPPAEAHDNAQKGKKPVVLYIVIALLVLVILVGGAVAAWFVFSLSSGQSYSDPTTSEDQSGDKAKDKKKKEEKKKSDEPPVFEKLDTFTVNLQGGTVLQTEIYVRVADEKQKEVIKNFLPLISSNVNLVLSAKKPEDVATTDGKEKLMAELKQTINKSLGAKDDDEGVISVQLKTFIVQ